MKGFDSLWRDFFVVNGPSSRPNPTAGSLLPQLRREKLRMLCELPHVLAHVFFLPGRKLRKRHDVLVGHVAKREVQTSRFEVPDVHLEHVALALVDALDAVEELILPA